MGNGNRSTAEFRREAVRLALTSGRRRYEIAEDLGIGLSTLTRWLSRERNTGEPVEASVDLHAELKRWPLANGSCAKSGDPVDRQSFARQTTRGAAPRPESVPVFQRPCAGLSVRAPSISLRGRAHRASTDAVHARDGSTLGPAWPSSSSIETGKTRRQHERLHPADCPRHEEHSSVPLRCAGHSSNEQIIWPL